MANTKKYDYAQICSERGYEYLYEKNPKVFIRDVFGFTHAIDRLNLAKGCSVGFKSVIENKTEYFKAIFKAKHGDQSNLFSFDNFEYIKSLEYSSVKCLKHGSYKTKPNWLLSRGHHCEMCAEDSRGNRKFLGEKGFIEKSRLVHGDKYDYSLVNYNGCREYVLLKCPVHGKFKQIPYYHLAGNGCPECGKDTGGYSATDYAKVCPKGSNVYLLKLHNNREMFYKIGISKNVHNRAVDIQGQSSYKVEVLTSKFFESASVAFYLEKILHSVFKNMSYTPQDKFQGYTECFKYIDKDEFEELTSEFFKL